MKEELHELVGSRMKEELHELHEWGLTRISRINYTDYTNGKVAVFSVCPVSLW
jgi:hypothetical protein